MSVVKTLENMEILIFHGDGTPKSSEEILKEIQEKCEKSFNKIKNGEKTTNQVRKEYGLSPIGGGDLKILENFIYKGYTDELKRLDEIYTVSEEIEPIDKEETTTNYVKRIDVTKLYEDATPIANKIIGILSNEDINFYTAEKVIELVERGIKTLKLKK